MTDPAPSPSSVPLEIRVVVEARYGGGLGVLMQFEHGYLVLHPNDARIVAAGLVDAAQRVERMAAGGS